jgi:hypothetical protein
MARKLGPHAAAVQAIAARAARLTTAEVDALAAAWRPSMEHLRDAKDAWRRARTAGLGGEADYAFEIAYAAVPRTGDHWQDAGSVAAHAALAASLGPRLNAAVRDRLASPWTSVVDVEDGIAAG